MRLPPYRRQLPPTAGLPLTWRDLSAPPADFAGRLAEQLHIPRPLLTCSGTAALIVALRTLQQRQPDRCQVIVPAWTCPLVALAAHYCPPLKILPCDLQPDSIDFDPDQLEKLCGPQTLAIVVTHLGGRVADAETACRIASRSGAAVIEDAAQALGAKDNGVSVGLKGDIGFYSLATGKGLTSIEGGVLFSRSTGMTEALARQVKKDLHPHAGWELRRIVELWAYKLVYNPDALDWFYGRPQRRALAKGDVVAAVGDDFTPDDIPLHTLGNYRQRVTASALLRLHPWQQENRLRALSRIAELALLPGVKILNDGAHQQGVWPFLMVVMPCHASRERAMHRLWRAGLGVTRLFIDVLSSYPAAAQYCLPGSVPNATHLAACSLTIGNSQWVTDEDFAQVVAVLKEALQP